MSLVKGPWDLRFGANVLAGIESLDVSYDVDSEDYNSMQGRGYTVEGAHRISVIATFLESDVPALAAVLPQHFVANGGTLSTGETVTDADGAIDVVPGASEGAVTTDLVVVSANNPTQTTRIPDCSTTFNNVEIDKVRKVMVKFTGESTAAIIQFFKSSAVSIVS